MEIRIFNNDKEISDFITEKWNEISYDAVRERGFFAVALSGGRTPADLYLRLSEKKSLPWNSTHIFQVDERFVTVFEPANNYAMIRDKLLRRVDVPEGNIHQIFARLSDPQTAAEAYEDELTGFFQLSGHSLPVFDLVLLGIGKDGHMASLLPGSEAIKVRDRLTAAITGSKIDHSRITLTLPVINNAKNVVFLVKGQDKANVVKEVIEKKNASLPASMVKPKGSLMFVMDTGAASLIRRP